MKNFKSRSYVIYIAMAIVAIPIFYIAIQFYLNAINGPVETNWSEVKSTMLANNDIERIVVVNEKKANIYLKQNSLNKYEKKFQGNYTQPADKGPHFTFNIGSVEKFERNLREAQNNRQDEILPEYKEERNWAGEILWTLGPIILIFFILIAYFIPSFIAKGKENFWLLFILNMLTGWTVIGWIGTLLWAINSKKVQQIYTHTCPNCDYKYEINQRIKLFVCPNCKNENTVTE